MRSALREGLCSRVPAGWGISGDPQQEPAGNPPGSPRSTPSNHNPSTLHPITAMLPGNHPRQRRAQRQGPPPPGTPRGVRGHTAGSRRPLPPPRAAGAARGSARGRYRLAGAKSVGFCLEMVVKPVLSRSRGDTSGAGGTSLGSCTHRHPGRGGGSGSCQSAGCCPRGPAGVLRVTPPTHIPPGTRQPRPPPAPQ